MREDPRESEFWQIVLEAVVTLVVVVLIGAWGYFIITESHEELLRTQSVPVEKLK